MSTAVNKSRKSRGQEITSTPLTPVVLPLASPTTLLKSNSVFPFLDLGRRPTGLLAGCLTGQNPLGKRVLGDWIYCGVVTAKLVIVTCVSLGGTGMAFSLSPRTGKSRYREEWEPIEVPKTQGWEREVSIEGLQAIPVTWNSVLM